RYRVGSRSVRRLAYRARGRRQVRQDQVRLPEVRGRRRAGETDVEAVEPRVGDAAALHRIPGVATHLGEGVARIRRPGRAQGRDQRQEQSEDESQLAELRETGCLRVHFGFLLDMDFLLFGEYLPFVVPDQIPKTPVTSRPAPPPPAPTRARWNSPGWIDQAPADGA